MIMATAAPKVLPNVQTEPAAKPRDIETASAPKRNTQQAKQARKNANPKTGKNIIVTAEERKLYHGFTADEVELKEAGTIP